MNKKGRKKVIPSYFQKSGDSLSSILQAGSYQRKIKQVLQKNKQFAKENQTLKVDLAHCTKSLQRCTSFNAHFLLAKKKLEDLEDTITTIETCHQTLRTGLKEVTNFLDMKEFLFMTSTDEEWRKLKLPPQVLEPIDEINSSVTEEMSVVEPQRTPVTRTSKSPITNLPETPNVADTSSTSSLGTPVLKLSPPPVKRPLVSIGGGQEARPPKRLRTPEKTVKNPSPKSILDQKPKPFRSPSKIPPSPFKKSPKLSKIPTRQKEKNALPEPSIAFLPLSPPASRKTFVVRKEDDRSDVVSSRLRRETFKVPISDTIENTANVPSPKMETGNNNGPITSGHTLMPDTNQSDDMEITAMLPLGQPIAFNPCPLPPSDEMELTAVLPVQCFLSAQNSAVPFPQVQPSRVSPEKTVVLTSKEVTVATGSGRTENALARKKSLRVKKSMGVRNADSEADENCQPSSKRMSFDDPSLNAHRKSVQFSFNECYNAFQNIKPKADPPKSILKQPTQDSEPSESKTPEPQKDTNSKAPRACINFSSSDDSTLTPTLPPDLFSEKCPQVKRNFSGVSERRSKKKTISGGDVFNEIQAFEETSPGCFVPAIQDCGTKSQHKTSESSIKKKDCAELKNATSNKNEIEASVETEPDSVVSLPKSRRKSPLKTSPSNKKKIEFTELEEPTSKNKSDCAVLKNANRNKDAISNIEMETKPDPFVVPTSHKDVFNEIEVSNANGTDSNCFVPLAPKCVKKPVAKTSLSSKKKKKISKDVLCEIEVCEETDKDPPVPEGRRSRSKTKTSTSNKKKKSTESEEARPSSMSSNIGLTEPRRDRPLSDTERRGRRQNSAKSYKEPSLNSKMRRE